MTPQLPQRTAGTAPHAPAPPAARPRRRWSRLTRTDLLVLVTMLAAIVVFRRAFVLLAAGVRFWPLSLMHCVVAGAALFIAVRSLRR